MQATKGSMLAMLIIAALLAGFGAWQFGGVGIADRGEEHESESDSDDHGKWGTATLPAGLGETLGGRIIEVESKREDGRWLYEIEVLDESGRQRRVLVDAETGAVVGREK